MAPKDSAEQRAANLLMNIFSAPGRKRAEMLANIPVVGGMFRRDPADIAAEQARQRGPRIPFLPELGISERLQTQFATPVRATEQAVSAINKAFLPEAAAASETPQAPPRGLDLSRPRPFAMTSEGQFDRYFKTPEMDQYFGAESRGKGAPADAAAMDKLASGKGVPEGTGIASKYRAESAMGRGNMDEIVEAMGYKGSPMETWARANPMLAFREYNKKFPAGEPTIGPTPAALQASEGPMTAFGQEVKTFFPGAEPGADADMGRLEGEELIDAYNYMRGQKGGSREPVSNRVGAFLGKYGDLGALTK